MPFDEPGLYGRVAANIRPRERYPRVTAQFVYKVAGQRKRLTLGVWPTAAAETLLRQYHQKAGEKAAGRDPQLERQARQCKAAQDKLKAELATTVSGLGRQFLERHSRVNKAPRSYRDDVKIFERDIEPVVGKLAIESVTRRHLAELVIRVTDRGSPIMANRVKALLSKMFNWAIDNGLLEASPAARLPSNKERQRQRVLSDVEIRQLWQSLDGNPIHIAAIKVLLLTGQRRSEVARMAWSEIEGGWWTIPSEHTKNAIAHRVPISPEVLKIIETPSGGNWVFEGEFTHVHPDTLTHFMAVTIQSAGLESCTTHDLRRTVGTFIQRKFGAEVMHKVLNHADDKLTRVYGQYDYDKEKRTALYAWARYIEELLAGEKSAEVINLQKLTA